MLVVLSQFLKSTLFKNLSAAVVILVIGVLIIRVLMRLIEASLNKSRLEKAAHSLILSLSKAAMYILLFLIAASTLGIDVSSIVALASVLTLALSLSLQNMVSNIIGGFTILYTHPFHSGDYVEIAGQAGTVREINMTYTVLTTFDNRVVSIPNSAGWKSTCPLPTMPPPRRCWTRWCRRARWTMCCWSRPPPRSSPATATAPSATICASG